MRSLVVARPDRTGAGGIQSSRAAYTGEWLRSAPDLAALAVRKLVREARSLNLPSDTSTTSETIASWPGPDSADRSVHPHSMICPPSAFSVWPVRYRDSSLARNTEIGAISSSRRPTRRSAMASQYCCARSGFSAKNFSAPGLSAAGLMTLTRMPNWPHSRAADRESARMPSLFAP
jgi:hypothetical protein